MKGFRKSMVSLKRSDWNRTGFFPLHLGMDGNHRLHGMDLIVSLSHLKLGNLERQDQPNSAPPQLSSSVEVFAIAYQGARSSEFRHGSMLAKLVIAGVVGEAWGN